MDLCQRLGRPGKSLAWPEAVSKRPATYSLTTVATLASRANGARGTRSTRGTGGSSRASLTTVALARKRKEVNLAPTERARLGQGSSRWGCGQGVQPSYLGARRTISSRGAFSTGRSLQRETEMCQPGEGGSGKGPDDQAEGTGMGLATAYLTSRLARGSSQSRGAHGTRGATFTT